MNVGIVVADNGLTIETIITTIETIIGMILNCNSIFNINELIILKKILLSYLSTTGVFSKWIIEGGN